MEITGGTFERKLEAGCDNYVSIFNKILSKTIKVDSEMNNYAEKEDFLLV